MNRPCGWCGWVLEAELVKIAGDNPDLARGDKRTLIPMQHGHRLYVLTTGTWRVLWAPNREQAEATARSGLNWSGPMKMRAFRAGDLAVVLESAGR